VPCHAVITDAVLTLSGDPISHKLDRSLGRIYLNNNYIGALWNKDAWGLPLHFTAK